MTYLNDELKMLRDETRAFVQNEVLPEANERDPKGEPMSDELITKLGEMGYFGIMGPEKYGGLDMGPLAYAVVAEELSRGWMSVASIIARGQNLHGATEEQKEEYVPDMVRGERLQATSISEPGAGSDVAGMTTTAEKVGDEYEIDGQKTWCTFAKGADFIVVYAKTDPDERHKGVSSFIIDKTPGEFDVDGLEANSLDKIGYKGWETWELHLDNVRIPEDKLIGGEEGQAFYNIMEFFEPARIHTAARAIGLARGALEDSLDYAQERQQFDQPIGEFQSIRFKLATMATKIESARQLTHYVAHQKEQGDRCDMEACMAKYQASEMAEEVTSEGIQIHGGNGYTTDYPLERYWRDARLTKIFEGTSEIQQRVIADRLFERGVHATGSGS
ncbi:butyryl-CoA dehydrogenase [Natronorubrum sediminis]|uniref:Butyryl-CoA dehydrogenase n=1 Tax=Natronorubrum sediminis TaxID=640943 RepID=A0A1H6G5D2_9EURY|nr:acyl-CoA dehydrogenase family protein [Natronorubrum sediminis]SEH17830.1 butyryl-CoA dehydrogenase [Natronorubrum sediminis]